MKKLLMTLVSFFFVAGTVVWAQDQDRDRTRKQDRIHQEDHLLLQDGKLYQFKQGEQTQVQAQIRLNNGTLINPDGSYQLQNQQRYQLRDGECLDMSGNRYLNQNRFNNRKMMTDKQIERVRTKTMSQNRLEDHLMLRDGKLYQFRQGAQTQIHAQIRLNNGTVINPDGSYQLQNQQRYQLRDGECLDMNGNRYLNQNRLNNRKMMTDKQIERARTRAMDQNRPGNQGSGGGNRSGQN